MNSAFIKLLLTAYAAVVPLNCFAQSQSKECSGHCLTFDLFIQQLSKEGDENGLLKLRADLNKFDTVPKVEREYIAQAIENAIEVLAARKAGHGEQQSAAKHKTARFSKIDENQETASRNEKRSAQTLGAKEDSESGLDYYRRVIEFATQRGDAFAIESVLKKISSDEKLRPEEHEEIVSLLPKEGSSALSGSRKLSAWSTLGAKGSRTQLNESDQRRDSTQQSPIGNRTNTHTGSDRRVDDSEATPASSEEEGTRPASGTGTERTDADGRATRDGANVPQPPTNSRRTGRNQELQLTPAANKAFSVVYQRLRQRYLDFFLFNGMSASFLNTKSDDVASDLTDDEVTFVKFEDQTVYMGQAMLAFAGEAKLLRERGISSESSETVIEILLDAFDRLDRSDVTPFDASVPGFFVRDDVDTAAYAKVIPTGWGMKSDFTSDKKSDCAMSVDQATSLFVGWWAISEFSDRPSSRTRAREQLKNVIAFLRDSKFLIRLPNGESIDNNRGADFRFAAGFYCRHAERVARRSYFGSSEIDVTIKGSPVRFNAGDLGEFELPGYKIPASLPVSLSHAAVLAVSPSGVDALSVPLTIPIRIGDMFPDVGDIITFPCAHMEPAHPTGHDVMTPCIHLAPAHPGGHENTVPCVHVTVAHTNGDTVPCIHLTVEHPGGDEVWTPCLHPGTAHDHDTVRIGGFKRDVPCVHPAPAHPGGHTNHVPCVHPTSVHPGGDRVPCVHPSVEHPEGDTVILPCVHMDPEHPEGDKVRTPCLHLEAAHPRGHGFDPSKIKLDIPLGSAIHSYSRHIVLQCFAFENAIPAPLMIPAAVQSKHIWSLLLRSQIARDIPPSILTDEARNAHSQIRGAPNNRTDGPWCRSNRWVWCTETGTPNDGPLELYNGLDFLSLEILMKLNGIK